MSKVIMGGLMAAVMAILVASAAADPLPGEILKFQQLPLDGLPIQGALAYFGHDEPSTAYLTEQTPGPVYRGVAMADDFADKRITFLPAQPVVHVRWWGSYLENRVVDPVTKFLIAFESDVPAVTEPFSHPGLPLLTQVVNLDAAGGLPAPGTYTEKLISPGGPPLSEKLYEYNAELNVDKWFPEQPDTVYWLKIVALVDGPAPDPAGGVFQTIWGWHDRDYTVPDHYASVPPAVSPGEGKIGTVTTPDGTALEVWHFQDDAVSSLVTVTFSTAAPGMPDVYQVEYEPQYYIDYVDGPVGISQFSKDLAFELYTVPEPASLAVIVLGGLAAVCRRRRR